MHILRARTHTQLASTHQNILGKHYANIVYRVSGSRAYAAVRGVFSELAMSSRSLKKTCITVILWGLV